MKMGLIFDMDGTLWDSSDQVVASWSMALDGLAKKTDCTAFKHGRYSSVVSVEYMRKMMGLPVIEIVRRLFPDMSDEDHVFLQDTFADYENNYLKEHGGRLYDGVSIILDQLSRQYHLYIVSNCQKGYIETFLDYYGFGHYFSDIECYGNTRLSKRENIEIIAKRNHLDRYIYIGDTQGDYYAAIGAGGDFIHASYGFGRVLESVPRLSTIYELPSVLKTMTA